MNLVGYHKCRIEAQSEMTDDLIVRLLLSLYFSRKSVAPEKAIWVMYSSTSSLVHAETVIDEFQGLVIRIDR